MPTMETSQVQVRERKRPMAEAMTRKYDNGHMCVHDFQPGNGTRYLVTLTFLGFPEMGDVGARDVLGARPEHEYMLVLHNIGPKHAAFVGSRTRPRELVTQLGVGIGDAVPLAEMVHYMCTGKDVKFRPDGSMIP